MVDSQSWIVNAAIVIGIFIMIKLFGIASVICTAAGYGVYSLTKDKYEKVVSIILGSVSGILLYILIIYLIYGYIL